MSHEDFLYQAFRPVFSTPVGALSRGASSIDLVTVGDDGLVWTTRSDASSPWPEWRRVNSTVSEPGSAATVLSRDPQFMDLFTVGVDGSVWLTWWNDEPWRDAGRIGTKSFPAPASITALSRNDDQMDIFAVDAEGQVWSSWWNGNPWRDWFRIGTKTFPAAAPVAALSRNDDQMDLFAVDADGQVWSSWWNGKPWRDWFRIGTKTFPAAAPVAALSRNDDQMDIFAVDAEGQVWSSWWNGKPWRDWFRIGTKTFPAAAPVAALSRNDDQMDLFAVDAEGQVWSSWWNGNPWRDWFRIGTHVFPPGSPITAVSRDDDHMDLFVVGLDRKVWTASWSGTWSDWTPIATKIWPFAPISPVSRAHTPADAYASHSARADSLARYHAELHPLIPLPDNAEDEDRVVGEDVPTQWIAFLHGQVSNPDRDLTVFRRCLRQRLPGVVGTNGDYDFALKGLMVMVYRYRDLLSEEDLTFILDKLVPPDLRGRHDPDTEIHMIAKDVPAFAEIAGTALLAYILTLGGLSLAAVTAAGFLVVEQSIYVAETENHLLMIEGCRLLVNQLLFERTGDKEYDSTQNGLADWLLDHVLHPLAAHDFLEFHARAYSRVSVHMLMVLHECAKDKRIRTACRILLDYVMVKFAVSSTHGRRITPFRRKQENTNHPSNPQNDLLLRAIGNDQVMGFFMTYVGCADRDGIPSNLFPAEWSQLAVDAGLAPYRPPPAAYSLALTKVPAYQHIFYHGTRPELTGSPDTADGGVEIYYRSPSFLLSAGGMFLNSGYGFDEYDLGPAKLSWGEVARAQAVTLLPTRAMDVAGRPPDRDVTFADLIRFDPWPDDWTRPNKDKPIRPRAINTGVCLGFACGANLRVPSKWLQLTGATWEGNWLFLDLDANLRDYGRLGFYVALYRTATVGVIVPDNLGLLYAMEADSMDFATFKQRTLERNADLPPILFSTSKGTFDAPDEDRTHFGYWLDSTEDKYRARAFRVLAGDPIDPPDLSKQQLAQGRYLAAYGRDGASHGGIFEIRGPECMTALSLDFSDPRNPQYNDTNIIASCPQPWADRAEALATYAGDLTRAGKHREAMALRVDRVAILNRIAQAHAEKYGPKLAAAVFDLLNNHRSSLGTAAALAYAERGVHLYEELAAVRKPGTVDPVDYENLAVFTPNKYWYAPNSADLTDALSLRATIERDQARNLTAAAAFTIAGLRVFQRLAAHDAATPFHTQRADALFTLVSYYRTVLDTTMMASFAEQGVYEYEVLAGLRVAGTHDPVDYDQLDAAPTNPFWVARGTMSLAGILRYVSYFHRDITKDQPAALSAMVRRLRLTRVVTRKDPRQRAALADTLFDLVYYYRPLSDAPTALSYAEQGVYEYEILANLRADGSEQPVNYSKLDQATPNMFWGERGSYSLAGALQNLSFFHRDVSGDKQTATAAMINRLRLFQRLVRESSTVRASLADTLFLLVFYYRGTLGKSAALAHAEDCVQVYEVLAGLRPAGSSDPVDYGNLEPFRPNPFWAERGLASLSLAAALLNVRVVHKEMTGDREAAATAWIKRLRVLHRVASEDPDTYRLGVAETTSLLLYEYREFLNTATALSFAMRGLSEYEILAGLRTASSHAPVDYQQLDAHVPNKYWKWRQLTGALYNLAYAQRAAGNLDEGSAAMRNRVLVAERLVKHDAIEGEKELTLAHKQAADYMA